MIVIVFIASMKLLQIPMFEDNYSYLLVDERTKNTAAVDPAESYKVLEVLEKENLMLTDILTTHYHW